MDRIHKRKLNDSLHILDEYPVILSVFDSISKLRSEILPVEIYEMVRNKDENALVYIANLIRNNFNEYLN